MSDLALIQTPSGGLDIGLDSAGVTADDGLRTAVILSLLTDRTANPDDELPDGSDNRRGYWADAWPAAESDRFGSRLWLLAREKDLAEVRRRAETYAEEALQWLIEDGIAQRIQVSAATKSPGVLGMEITIHRFDGGPLEVRFNNLWEGV